MAIRIRSGFLVVMARHLKLKSGIWWYQRRHPKDLRDKLGLSVHVRKSLGTRDLTEAVSRAQKINAEVEARWRSLRGDTFLTPHSQSPSEARPEQALRATELFAGEPASCREDASGGGPRNRAETATAPRLADALDLYLRQHPKGGEKRFAGNTRLAISKVTEAARNLRLSEYTRQHANQVRDAMLEGGLKTTSVKRRFESICAVFKAAVDEHALKAADGLRPLDNPFAGIRIAALGHDAEKREEFTTEELGAIAQACHKLGDDRRLIISLLMDTGARLGEVVGIRVSDLCLDAAVPYIHIRPYQGRTVKTASSERMVPLVGEALWATQRAVADKDPAGLLFPVYGPTKANSASAALNKWLKTSPGIPKTVHGFRHSMKTRLRLARVPEDIRNRIGGWTDGASVSRGYGSYPLELLREHLEKVVLR